ncbi:MAG: 6-phosphogluconolactonase [Chloroflexi bacterium]|nr:6-phosphogluconolactonase [Chloroflexota bacterium]
MNIQIHKNLEALSRAAVEFFAASAAQAISERGRFLVALSGGKTPQSMFQMLPDAPVGWPRVHVFWADERCVPSDDPGSNYGQARRAFLDKVKIPEENVHRVQSDLEPAEASKSYALTLSGFAEPPLEFPRFDLVLLGMGDDGHTASLFPGSEVDASTPTLAVTAQYQDRPANRVTLTPKVFNAARQIIFLVSGESKAETLARVLDDENYQPETLPAQRIHPLGGAVTWMVDEDAASKLPRRMKQKFCEG